MRKLEEVVTKRNYVVVTMNRSSSLKATDQAMIVTYCKSLQICQGLDITINSKQ